MSLDRPRQEQYLLHILGIVLILVGTAILARNVRGVDPFTADEAPEQVEELRHHRQIEIRITVPADAAR